MLGLIPPPQPQRTRQANLAFLFGLGKKTQGSVSTGGKKRSWWRPTRTRAPPEQSQWDDRGQGRLCIPSGLCPRPADPLRAHAEQP